MRIAFLGTPAVSTIPLRALAQQHEIVLVVTQPDKRRGRGSSMNPTPVKLLAEELALPVSHSMNDLVQLEIDYAVVAAFGRIIPKQVLDAHTYINIHPSLLPRWRGAAPVEHTILSGETETGVCLMKLTQEMDAGPLYQVVRTEVGAHEHANELLTRLFELGTGALVDALANGLDEPVPQTGEPTYANKFEPGDFRIDWTQPAIEVDRLVRIDRAWTVFRGKRLRILESEVVNEAQLKPGEIDGEVVGTGSGALRLLEVKPEGGRVMSGLDWANGTRIAPDEHLE